MSKKPPFHPPVLAILAAFLLSAAPYASPVQITEDPAEVAKRWELSDEALRIHREAIVIDGHNDFAYQLAKSGNSSLKEIKLCRDLAEFHTDIRRLRQGGVGAQFWAAWVWQDPESGGANFRAYVEQVDLIHRMAEEYPCTFEMAYTADDIVRIHREGKIASLIGIEGGYAIENSLALLRSFYRMGARYMTLTHWNTIDWADSATGEAKHGGLTEFGEEVVLEMNRLGMMVDISHVSPETMQDVLRVSRAPILATHSSAYALASHPRNIPDHILREIARKKGLVMVNFFSGFLTPEGVEALDVQMEYFGKMEGDETLTKEKLGELRQEYKRDHPIPRGTVDVLVDHIDHIVKVAGIDHVGLGSDFDGISVAPEPLEDVSDYPHITQELMNRGYSEKDIQKILGGNLLRVMREVEAEAVALEDQEESHP